MKKNILLLLFAFNFTFSQSNYKPAYYITNSGNRVDGYVLYSELQANQGIDFKTSLNDKNLLIDTKNFSELHVGDEKFISRNVEYATNRLTDSSEFIKSENSPEYKTSQLLMEVLVEGNASLYVAKFDQVTLYFIKMAESDKIMNLVYYKYKEINDKANNGYTTNEYNLYRKQLLQYLNCNGDTDLTKYNAVKYFESDLKKVISDYNICKTGVNNDLAASTKKHKLKIAALLGAKLQNPKFKNDNFYGTINADSNLSPALGVELSYLFPTKSEGAEIFGRISFDKVDYYATNQTKIPLGVTTIYESVKFKSNFLHFDIGPRYYFRGGLKNSLFVDASLGYSILFSDEFGYSISSSNVENLVQVQTKPYFSLNAGVGYALFKRYSLDIHYSYGGDFLQPDISNFNSNISSLSLNLKYIF